MKSLVLVLSLLLVAPTLAQRKPPLVADALCVSQSDGPLLALSPELRDAYLAALSDMGWRLRVEAWEAGTVEGLLAVGDPDGIVEQVRHVSQREAPELLRASPRWVHEPVGDWLNGTHLAEYGFVLRGAARSGGAVERVR